MMTPDAELADSIRTVASPDIAEINVNPLNGKTLNGKTLNGKTLNGAFGSRPAGPRGRADFPRAGELAPSALDRNQITLITFRSP
jgi:hypothetical protein